MEEPLTLAHLLIGRQVLNLPDNFGNILDSDDGELAIDANQLDRRVKHLTNTIMEEMED